MKIHVKRGGAPVVLRPVDLDLPSYEELLQAMVSDREGDSSAMDQIVQKIKDKQPKPVTDKKPPGPPEPKDPKAPK